MSRGSLALCVAVAASAASSAHADDANGIDPSEANGAQIKDQGSHWNEVNLKLLTMRFGAGVLDATSQDQMPGAIGRGAVTGDAQ